MIHPPHCWPKADRRYSRQAEDGARWNAILCPPSLFRAESGLGRRRFLLPSAPGRLHDQPFLDGAGGNPDIAHFAVDDGFDALELQGTPFGDRGDMRADAAASLRLAAAPDDAALDRAFACQFTNSRHINPRFRR